ncbi:hypothetical protein GJ496_003874 [Pomphorhynchus laevis]|nr:hypothetical protein GJ496_003874 [Pomphorhynchus laevis]
MCPVCGLLLSANEVEEHYQEELKRLTNNIRTNLFEITKSEEKYYAATDQQHILSNIVDRIHLNRKNRIKKKPYIWKTLGFVDCNFCNTTIKGKSMDVLNHLSDCIGSERICDYINSRKRTSNACEQKEPLRDSGICSDDEIDVVSVNSFDRIMDFVDINKRPATEESFRTSSPIKKRKLQECSTEVNVQTFPNNTDNFNEECAVASNSEGRLCKSRYQVHCELCKALIQKPTVSIKCMHMFCSNCWLEALNKYGTCPKCKLSTHASNLRHIRL